MIDKSYDMKYKNVTLSDFGLRIEQLNQDRDGIYPDFEKIVKPFHLKESGSYKRYYDDKNRLRVQIFNGPTLTEKRFWSHEDKLLIEADSNGKATWFTDEGNLILEDGKATFNGVPVKVERVTSKRKR